MNTSIQSENIDTSAVLQINGRYVVQDTAKFPKHLRFLIGKTVVVRGFNGTNVSILFAQNLQMIPARSLINHSEYGNAGMLRHNNTDAYVVTASGKSYQVGTIIKRNESMKVNEKTGILCFQDNGKTVELPIAWVVGLKKKNESFPTRTIATVDTKTRGKKLAKEINVQLKGKERDEIPLVIQRLLPNLSVDEIMAEVINRECFDYDGGHHLTIVDAEIANKKIIEQHRKNAILKMAVDYLTKELS